MDNFRTLNVLLNRFTDKNVKIRQDQKTEALDLWQPIVNRIVENVKGRDDRFSGIQIVPTGSYYERSKVGEPDEFDLLLVVEKLALDADPYDDEDDGMSDPPKGFTRVMIDRGEERIWSRDNCVNSRGMLSSARVKSVFARLVREAIQQLGLERFVIKVTSNGPAVTLLINRNGREYSIDLTIGIKDKSWPEDADEWKTRSRNGWPNQNLVQEIWRDGCHLVGKQAKGANLPEREKEYLWIYSFPTAEKKLFRQGAHGEEGSCRKQVLRILKALKEELDLHPLKSYHLKTMLFYECEANPHPSDWSSQRLGDRFMGLLRRLENCLVQKKCPNYFIREVNLFEMFPQQRCVELARRIQQIKSNPEQVLNNLIA